MTAIETAIGREATFTRCELSFADARLPRDPVVIGVVTLLLAAVALVACCLPARRAAHLSPLEALHTD